MKYNNRRNTCNGFSGKCQNILNSQSSTSEQEEPEGKRDLRAVKSKDTPIDTEKSSMETEYGVDKECQTLKQEVRESKGKGEASESDELVSRVLSLEEQIRIMQSTINQLTDVLKKSSVRFPQSFRRLYLSYPTLF